MVYLDNAATTFPKPKAVISEVKKCISEYCGNPGRSGHTLSLEASERIYEAREAIAVHFGFSRPENVVFTYNATYALNIAMWAKIPKNSHVLCSDIEHNAVVRPLNLMKDRGYIDYSLFSTDGDIEENIKNALTPRTKAIVSTLCSNVTGKKLSLRALSRIASDNGLILIVDASQAAGHEKFDLSRTPCACFCAPGHKGLFGIQGSGFVIFGEGEHPRSVITGGSGSNSKSPFMPVTLPESQEAGTLSTPSIASLLRGVEFINAVGIEEISYKESLLCDKIKSGLSVIKGVKLYETEGSIVLFNGRKGMDMLLSNLDKCGICVRGGYHCAPSAHIRLGTEKTGAIRASVSYLNSVKDADYFLKSVSKIAAEI